MPITTARCSMSKRCGPRCSSGTAASYTRSRTTSSPQLERGRGGDDASGGTATRLLANPRNPGARHGAVVGLPDLADGDPGAHGLHGGRGRTRGTAHDEEVH